MPDLCYEELKPEGQDILRPTFIIAFQVSTGCFSLRSTWMRIEGLLYAFRGRSSFAKCLGVKLKIKINKGYTLGELEKTFTRPLGRATAMAWGRKKRGGAYLSTHMP